MTRKSDDEHGKLTQFTVPSTGQTGTAYLAVKRGQSCFEGGKFVQTASAAYQLYRDLEFTNAERQTLEWLCEHIDDGNKVYEITHDRIARTCKLRRATVSEAMKRFEDNKLFRRLSGRAGVIALNPRYWYQGTLDEQKKAVEQWDRWQWEDLTEELNKSMSQESNEVPHADR